MQSFLSYQLLSNLISRGLKPENISRLESDRNVTRGAGSEMCLGEFEARKGGPTSRNMGGG